MANACLLETPDKHSHVAAGQHSSTHRAHADHALVGDTVAIDDDGDSDAAKESCLKACDDASNAPVKLQTGIDLTDPGLAPLIVSAWNAAPPIAPVSSRFEDLQVPGAGPPLRLRYSRLTL